VIQPNDTITTPRFISSLDLRLHGRGKWITLSSLVYDSVVAQRRIIVPAEFVTDLASVPRVPFAYMLTGAKAPGPATLHDFGYQNPDEEDRNIWDSIFLESMEVHQPELGFEAESWLIRRLMYRGVRIGGWVAWNNHRERGEDLNPIWTADGWPSTLNGE
jgi:hypothetical protein